ncbi:transposase [Avibacterium sp. 21-599]|uniref:transposase n=1 Tax=Avibacterium sp. 21-599 TaxID=2911528 RepID=UPI0022484301|nr:transposase [Avibacterium sp. 21-599]MCW9718098.1 transposase [Avibacterium sp. 21-599]
MLTAYSEAGYDVVYLDESGFEKQTFRTHGYAPVGEKCQATHNWQKMATRTNAIGAIREGNLFALRLFYCPIDSDIFYVWLTEALLPELEKPTVIVMDNAAFHKRQDIIEAIERTEHKILWLPPYSPDLNPIEKTWAWVKSLRKQWRLDCVDALFFWILTIVSVF